MSMSGGWVRNGGMNPTIPRLRKTTPNIPAKVRTFMGRLLSSKQNHTDQLGETVIVPEATLFVRSAPRANLCNRHAGRGLSYFDSCARRRVFFAGLRVMCVVERASFPPFDLLEVLTVKSRIAPRSVAASSHRQPMSLIEGLERRTLFAAAHVTSIITDNRGEVNVTFDQALNPATVKSSTVQVHTAGPDGVFGTADDAKIDGIVRLKVSNKRNWWR